MEQTEKITVTSYVNFMVEVFEDEDCYTGKPWIAVFQDVIGEGATREDAIIDISEKLEGYSIV